MWYYVNVTKVLVASVSSNDTENQPIMLKLENLLAARIYTMSKWRVLVA